MGHWSHTCKLTGIPITGGTPAVLIPLVMRKNIYDNSESRLKESGSTYMCSNEGNQLKFHPCFFPIKGRYDDYGGLEDIVEDDNTKVLEEIYGMPIQDIVNLITGSSRNREGNNYNDKTIALKKVSGMWVHREVYEKLGASSPDSWWDKLDLGTPALLKALGFKEGKKDKDRERYNVLFSKGDVKIYSDGTWMRTEDCKSMYSLPEFKKYCEGKGVELDISRFEGVGRVGQIIDVVVPEMKSLKGSVIASHMDSMQQTVAHYLLNRDRYNLDVLPQIYFKALKKKGSTLGKNVTEFWNFDTYLFSTGTFYDLVGTCPQDGERRHVKTVLETALEVLNKDMADRRRRRRIK
jgi:hypothetical protein